jgi:hypothetical protein
VEFNFAPSGCSIFSALYTITFLGAAAASLGAAQSLPLPPSVPHHRCHLLCHCHIIDVVPSSLPPLTHHHCRCLPRHRAIATAGLGLDTTATAVPNPDFFVDCNTMIFTRK